MLQISLGPLQRPAMRSCYVVWSRERLVVGRIWKKSIGSEGPTHKDMWLLIFREPGQIKVKPVARILPVYIITKVLVYRRPLMKQKESYTGTFVHLVGQKMGNSLHTHNLNVGNRKVNQKTNKDGHAKVQTCPSFSNTNCEHAPFSSPGSLKSVFQRAMAFCNKRDNRSYAQVLSSQCDSPFHNTDKWSSSTAGSCYMDSTSASGGQYSNKTHQFGGSKHGVLYKECKQLC